MFPIHRRGFLQTTATGVAATIALPTASARAVGAGERLVVGLIGCGGQGKAHIASLSSLDDVEIAYVCDPDSDRLREAAAAAGKATPVADFRRILDDPKVDAVSIATPDHWHAPAALAALKAGKHVYVEKPCAHNLREGRLLVNAARQQGKVVQHGTQSRSSPFLAGAVQMLREGIIGDVLVAKAWNIQRRGNIGHAQPGDPPSTVDYDAWLGPAPAIPFQSNRFHYHWHWWHPFGTGDMGNDGVHDIDYARWGLGVEEHPTRIAGLGGKYFFDDDQQFPDTQTVVFEYPGNGQPGGQRQLIFEMRIWSTSYPYNVDSGAEFFGTKGKMFLSKRGKVQVWDEGNHPVEVKGLSSDAISVPAHHRDFVDAIKLDRRPNADIEIGHLSASLVHLGNIATRLGRTLDFDPKAEQVRGDDEANRMLSREYRSGGHWAVPAGV